MKKLLFVLLLVPLMALANSWEASNSNNGKIVLTDTLCTGTVNTYVAFSQSNSGPTLFGCWFFAEGYAMVTWSDGDVRSYPANIFVKRYK